LIIFGIAAPVAAFARLLHARRSDTVQALGGEVRCRIQLCGRLRVEVDGTRVEDELGGRQGQLLLAYLVLNRFREVPRAEILVALWPNGPQPAERALSTLLSKVRRALGGHLEGKAELRLALPPETWIDLEVAEEELHRAEAALGKEAWARAYSSAHVALYIAERGFLSGCELEWAREVRRRVEGVRVQGSSAPPPRASGSADRSFQSQRRTLAEQPSWRRFARARTAC
jgi:hypothetical protein